MANISLHTALKSSYGNREAQRNLQSNGYTLDRELSNGNQQFYYNKSNGKLLNTIAGTHSIKDIGTDIWLAGGKLQNTSRFKEAERRLNSAKAKYKPKETNVIGHSLGGSIAQTLSSKADNTTSLDSGYTIGQKTRGNSYRTQGDAVSLLGANAKHQKTIQHGNILSRNKGSILGGVLGGPLGLVAGIAYDAIQNHDIDKIKGSKIFI